MKEFNYQTKMAVPHLVKITINMVSARPLQNAKLLEAAEVEMTAIAGQKPVVTKARKSIATFNCARGRRSAAWSRCAATGCTSSSIAW